MNILVTGGSRGIGRAICVALAAPGRTILINYLRNDKAAEETADMVRERGAEAWPRGAGRATKRRGAEAIGAGVRDSER